MATYNFIAPPFVTDESVEAIHQRMMKNLPPDIDKTEGGFPWDFTRPTALEKSELIQFHLLEAIKLMHYMFAQGIYLDYHAESVGLTRKSPTAASGTLHLTGSPGVEIPVGFQFAVPANGEAAAIIFETAEFCVIDHGGEADVTVVAQETGLIGNVSANTITIMASPTISGIQSITNEEPITGGSVTEDDDSLRDRIREVYENTNASFCGCDADYRRWALEADGIGQVTIVPEWDGPGTVKIILIDANGAPANETLINAVYNSIVSPNDRSQRKAPIGATVTVTSPSTLNLTVSATLTLATGADLEAIKETISASIVKYLSEAHVEGIVKTSRIGAAIIDTDGVVDYSELKINNGTSNITIQQDEYPVLQTLTLSEVS